MWGSQVLAVSVIHAVHFVAFHPYERSMNVPPLESIRAGVLADFWAIRYHFERPVVAERGREQERRASTWSPTGSAACAPHPADAIPIPSQPPTIRSFALIE